MKNFLNYWINFCIVALLIFFISCASVQLPSPPIPLKDSDFEGLVPPPIEERQQASLPKGSFGKKILLKGETSSGDGVLLDDFEVARLGLIKAERDRLLSDLFTERKLKLQMKYLYEKALWQADVKYIQSQPSFLERHAGKIGLCVGMAFGSALAIGVAASIAHVTK